MASGDSTDKQGRSWFGLSPSGLISGVTNTVKNTVSTVAHSIGIAKQEEEVMDPSSTMADTQGDDQVNRHRSRAVQVCQTRVPVCQTRSLDSKELLDDCIKETEIEKLSGILKKRDQQILALREETDVIQRRNLALESNKKELESKVQSLEKQVAQMSKLRHSRGGKDEDQGNAAKLQEHLKEQSRVIMGLRKDQEQRDVEASEDKGKIHELEDEILRLQEDFQSARESMEQLKEQNKKLLSGRYVPQPESNIGTEDSCSNPTCQAMQYQIIALREENEERKKIVTNLEDTVSHLQQEKNTALEQCSLAKVEAEIFKSDFEEERKDREKAQGLLANFQGKKNFGAMYQEQEKKLREERDAVIKERNDLKRKLSKAQVDISKLEDSKASSSVVIRQHMERTEALNKAKDYYKEQYDKLKSHESSKSVIEHLRKKVESLNNELKTLKKAVKSKDKEIQDLETQLSHSHSFAVTLTTEGEKVRGNLSSARQEIQSLKKAKKTLESNMKKLEKSGKKASQQSPPEPQSMGIKSSSIEELYDRELRINFELREENEKLRGQIEVLTMDVAERKKLLMDMARVQPSSMEDYPTQLAATMDISASGSSGQDHVSKPPQQQIMEHDIEEKTSPSPSSRLKLYQQQHNQQTSESSREVGQSNLDKTQRLVTAESQNNPPLPPRQRSGPSSRIQSTNSSRSRDGSDHECLYQDRQGADNVHSFGNFDERSHVLSAGNRGGEPIVSRESQSTWPVGKSERPLRAGANNAQVDSLVNQGNSSQQYGASGSRGYEGKSFPNVVSGHRSRDDGIPSVSADEHIHLAHSSGEDQHCYESNNSGAMPLRAGAGHGKIAKAWNYNEGQPLRAGAKDSHSSHSFASDDRNKAPLRAGQENQNLSEMDSQRMLTGESSHLSQAGYDDRCHEQVSQGRYLPQGSSRGDYPSRKGDQGNYSTSAESHSGRRNIEQGGPKDYLHPASAQSGFMQQGQEHNFEVPNQCKSTESGQMQKYSQHERRGSSNEISAEIDLTGLEQGVHHDRELMYGIGVEGAVEFNQQQRSREYLARQRGNGGSNFETTRNEQKHRNYGPNSPSSRYKASQHSRLNGQPQSQGERYTNEEQRKTSHSSKSQSMKEDFESHQQQVQAAAMASASQSAEYPAAPVNQGLHKEHGNGESNLSHQAKFSEGQTVTARRVASQNPGRAEFYSEEQDKDRHQAKDQVRLPDTRKPHSLPQQHHDSDVKPEQVILKDLSVVDTITPDKNEQKDKAPTTENNPKAEESKSAQSDASSDTDDKSLHKDIDDDIKVMAQEIDNQVNRDPSTITTIHRKPMDPNLICPICGKQFRIGEIQKFRAHVDNCV